MRAPSVDRFGRDGPFDGGRGRERRPTYALSRPCGPRCRPEAHTFALTRFHGPSRWGGGRALPLEPVRRSAGGRLPEAGAVLGPGETGPAAHPQLPPDSPAALALLPPTARRVRPRQRVGPPLVRGLVGEGPHPRAGSPTPTPNPPQSLEEAPDPAAHGQHPDGAPADPRALCRFRPRRSATSVNCSSPSPRLMPPRNAPRTTPTTSPSSSPPPGWASSPYFSYARPEAHPREPQPVDEDDGYLLPEKRGSRPT